MVRPRKKELDLNGFLALRANSGFMEGAAQVGDGGWVMTTKKSRLGVTSSIYSLRLETFFFFFLNCLLWREQWENRMYCIYVYLYTCMICITFRLPMMISFKYVQQICVYKYIYIYWSYMDIFIYIYILHMYIYVHLSCALYIATSF